MVVVMFDAGRSLPTVAQQPSRQPLPNPPTEVMPIQRPPSQDQGDDESNEPPDYSTHVWDRIVQRGPVAAPRPGLATTARSSTTETANEAANDEDAEEQDFPILDPPPLFPSPADSPFPPVPLDREDRLSLTLDGKYIYPMVPQATALYCLSRTLDEPAELGDGEAHELILSKCLAKDSTEFDAAPQYSAREEYAEQQRALSNASEDTTKTSDDEDPSLRSIPLYKIRLTRTQKVTEFTITPLHRTYCAAARDATLTRTGGIAGATWLLQYKRPITFPGDENLHGQRVLLCRASYLSGRWRGTAPNALPITTHTPLPTNFNPNELATAPDRGMGQLSLGMPFFTPGTATRAMTAMPSVSPSLQGGSRAPDVQQRLLAIEEQTNTARTIVIQRCVAHDAPLHDILVAAWCVRMWSKAGSRRGSTAVGSGSASGHGRGGSISGSISGNSDAGEGDVNRRWSFVRRFSR